ncbi:MAG: penicillin acylase family protein [Rubrivivax sp.]
MPFRPSALACAAALSLMAASTASLGQSATKGLKYQVQVQRTSYGIPHIRAADWASMGYGYGYAFSQDNVCVLAREMLVASGTQSRWFGAASLSSDRVYKMVNSTARIDAAWAAVEPMTRDLLTGYADGYNRYLRDTGNANLPADCKGQPWVQPITGKDAMKVLRKLLVRASTGNFIGALVAAVPPAARPITVKQALLESARVTHATAVDDSAAESAIPVIDTAYLPDFDVERFGSNGVGLGGDLTGGSGALLGNPHFPWYGIERFYAVHMTIPGVYDVMGASIYGFPLVNFGFNKDIAWTHTVSTARRFILRELQIAPGNPTAYVYDGQPVAMQPEAVSVDVLQADGSVLATSHTFWQTQFGPVMVPTPSAPWSTTRAYAMTDVNLENLRAFRQYRTMGQARSIDEFDGILRSQAGLPWVNTIAADSGGNAYYADIGAMPNVTNAKLAACIKPGVSQALAASRLYALDGSTSACNPGTDADAPEPGIFGGSSMPGLIRRDYVQNSNDSYWLSNPSQPLEGYSQIIGTDEGKAQAFRTRLGIQQVRDRQAGVDGLPGGTAFNRQWLQDMLYADRHYSAEIMLDGVLALCASQNPEVTISGQVVNVAQACGVLSTWDRRNRSASVGAHVWTEFWRRLSGAASAGLPVVSTVLYAVPFSAADPVNTPRGLNGNNATVITRVMGEMAYTVKTFADNGIPLTRPWGEVQFDTRNGVRIPIHGGSGTSGVYNAISPAGLVNGVGYTPIVAGSSYIQSVSFTGGLPVARAVVTYSQSSDPANPHFADMTQLFSGYGWVSMPFTESDIRADPNLTVIRLIEAR